MAVKPGQVLPSNSTVFGEKIKNTPINYFGETFKKNKNNL